MRNIINIIGERRGKITILSFKERVNGRTFWNGICDCGKETTYRGNTPKKSCGCLWLEITKGFPSRATTHSMSSDKFYKTYRGILVRCNNVNDHNFRKYGGRGIKCLWKSFENFKEDMYESYQSHVKEFGKRNTTIDRIDSTGNYSKENCRWATAKEQQRNKTNNHVINHNELNLCIAEWAELFGLDYHILYRRLMNNNWSIDKAITN